MFWRHLCDPSVMRGLLLITAVGLLVGCQHDHMSGSASTTMPATQPAHEYRDQTASALAFDPPVIAVDPPLDLSRAGRGASAYLGYDEVTVTNFYLRTDDRQDDRGGDRYDRHALSERFSVRYR